MICTSSHLVTIFIKYGNLIPSRPADGTWEKIECKGALPSPRWVYIFLYITCWLRLALSQGAHWISVWSFTCHLWGIRGYLHKWLISTQFWYFGWFIICVKIANSPSQDTMTWSVIETHGDIPRPRHYHSAAIYQDRMWVQRSIPLFPFEYHVYIVMCFRYVLGGFPPSNSMYEYSFSMYAYLYSGINL